MYKFHPDLGNVWLPSKSISLPKMAVRVKPTNSVLAVVRRPEWSIRGEAKFPDVERPYPDGASVMRQYLAPYRDKWPNELFGSQVVWADVSHNERVDAGARHNVHRMFGTVGSSASTGHFMAISNTTLTKAKTDDSLGNDAMGNTGTEFTTIGLSRAAGTPQNYAGPGALNGTFSTDIYKSYSVTGTGVAYGSGLFDSVTVATGLMLVEDNFGSTASVVNGDTLNVTWTWTH